MTRPNIPASFVDLNPKAGLHSCRVVPPPTVRPRPEASPPPPAPTIDVFPLKAQRDLARSTVEQVMSARAKLQRILDDDAKAASESAGALSRRALGPGETLLVESDASAARRREIAEQAKEKLGPDLNRAQAAERAAQAKLDESAILAMSAALPPLVEKLLAAEAEYEKLRGQVLGFDRWQPPSRLFLSGLTSLRVPPAYSELFARLRQTPHHADVAHWSRLFAEVAG